MRSLVRWLGLAVCFAAAVHLSCFSVPQLVWPQDDIAPAEMGPANGPSVLIASRTSAFKEELVKHIAERLVADSAHVKIRGMRGLADQETSAPYAAVVLVNTCMSWDMDRNAKRFLKRNPDHAKMIVLTTSGSGHWMPSERHRDFDAISGASAKDLLSPLADSIVAKVTALAAIHPAHESVRSRPDTGSR